MTTLGANYPNATETMAELAWRYGDRALPKQALPGWLFDCYLYSDHSAILFGCSDGRPICVLRDLEFLTC